jgi:uncharacterized protein YbjT (DUF2867 family)
MILPMSTPRILLTGASGYVGGRLLARLRQQGVAVRCLARRPDSLDRHAGRDVEVVQGDLLDPGSLGPAFAGIEMAYYLVHSMGSGPGYAELDRQAADAFGAAARRAGVRRIIYLGGLADPDAPLSRHLRSRLDTGDRLRASGVPVTEFRASIVLGSGSLSFEMIRALVERLPVMLWPRWVRTLAQPIGIDDLIAYLAVALEAGDDADAVTLHDETSRGEIRRSEDPKKIHLGFGSPDVRIFGDSRRPVSAASANYTFEIGGSGTASYGDLMREYARQRGLRRLMIPVPFLTPKLSSLWLGLVTPVYARVGRELIDGVRNASVVRDRRALEVFPIRPAGYREAMALAIGEAAPETRWADARSSSRPSRTWPDTRFGRRIVDVRERVVPVPCAAAFLPVQRIGGARGWYFGDGLWTVRGWLDLLVGGPGLRRGRRDAELVRVGDTLDFWRVEAFDPGRRLRLQAEMRLPGRAWLEFEVEPHGNGSVIRQTATFDPVGLAGRAYWYALYPGHALMFRGMLRRIAQRAGEEACAPSGGTTVDREGR